MPPTQAPALASAAICAYCITQADGDGSLGTDTINFSFTTPQTIYLRSGINITRNSTITNASVGPAVTIDGSQLQFVGTMFTTSGTTAPAVEFDDLAFANAQGAGTAGCISDSDLTVNNCTFNHNAGAVGSCIAALDDHRLHVHGEPRRMHPKFRAR